MRSGQPSITAQRVAAQRLSFSRTAAPYGDPAADDLLGRDVAGEVIVDSTSPMSSYLAARTAFFDRVVVGSLGRGVTQVVVAGAGYDGRALRYAKPGVQWYEVDHPVTQRDKLHRLARLAVTAPQVAFVSADFTLDDVGVALESAGHDAELPTLFLCEGVAVYLERAVLKKLLQSLRSRAAAGSRMAISLSVTATSAASVERRSRFQSAVAALGEPARSVLTADDAVALFAATGWREAAQPTAPAGHDQPARRAGFVLATSV